MTLWNDLLGLQDELQRMLQTPGSFFREPSARGVFPPLNVFRGPDGLIVRDLPRSEPSAVIAAMDELSQD